MTNVETERLAAFLDDCQKMYLMCCMMGGFIFESGLTDEFCNHPKIKPFKGFPAEFKKELDAIKSEVTH